MDDRDNDLIGVLSELQGAIARCSACGELNEIQLSEAVARWIIEPALICDHRDQPLDLFRSLSSVVSGGISLVPLSIAGATTTVWQRPLLPNGLTQDGEAAIDERWTPASPIQLIDVTQALTRKARALIRKARIEGHGIRGADAIHLASAVMFGCAPIFTYEASARRTRWEQATGTEVTEPYTNKPQLGV